MKKNFLAALVLVMFLPAWGMTAEPDFDLGSLYKEKYTNSFFGLSFSVPWYWRERDYEKQRELREKIKKRNRGSAKRGHVDFGGESSLCLLVVNLDPLSKYYKTDEEIIESLRRPDSPNRFDPSRLPKLEKRPQAPVLKGRYARFSCSVKKLSLYNREARTPAGYLMLEKSRVQRLGGVNEFYGEIREVTLGGASFAVMSYMSGTETMRGFVTRYATFRKGMILDFIMACDDRGDLAHMGPIISSVRFEDEAKK